MTKKQTQIAVPDEVVLSKIYQVRGQKVMIDRDLAELYGVETKRLKEAVRRNANRFPEDFMFEMDDSEFEHWRTQNATSNPADRMGLRYAPFCFTEQGVTMLSCVLNSDRAIAVNIQVIRLFTKMREMWLTHKDLILELEKIRNTVGIHSRDIKRIFNHLNKMAIEEKNRLLLAGIEKEKKAKHKQILGFDPKRNKPKK